MQFCRCAPNRLLFTPIGLHFESSLQRGQSHRCHAGRCSARANLGDNERMQISLFAAFIAGLISFLSPCVLPLVPGYISMLSGIGMEQLRQGQPPRSGLFSSSLSFVIGFSVVFISFGATASAVGKFLQQNRNLLAPIAGALILLFGLHLLGILIKLSVRAGLIIGAVLAALGIIALLRGGVLFAGFGAVHFFSLSL